MPGCRRPLRLLVLALASILAVAGTRIVIGAPEPSAAPGAGPPSFAIPIGSADAGQPLDPGQVVVSVEGRRVEPVERLAPAAAGPLRVVLYLDLPSTRPASVQALATAITDQSERLAAVQGLEIVEADPEPRSPERFRSREELEQIASRLVLRDAADDEIARLRADFLSSLDKLSVERRAPATTAGAEAADGSSGAGTVALSPSTLAEEAYRLEMEHRRARQDELLAWIEAQGRSPGRRLLLLLDDDLALDAASFYRDRVTGPDAPVLATGAAPSADALATTAAAYGWTLVPLVPDAAGAERRLRYAPSPQTPVGFRLGLDRRRPAAEPTADLGLAPRGTEAVDRAARRTGGERLSDFAMLADSIDRFAARPVLRFTVPGLAAGESQPLSIEAPGGRRLLAPDLVTSGTPPQIAGLRARRAIAGETVEGGLVVRSAIEFDPGAVAEVESHYEARVDLVDLRRRRPGLDRASFRVTLAVHVESDDVLVKHDVVRDVALLGRDEWLQEGTLRLPSQTDGAVVLVELLETGDWGESFASFVRVRPGVPSPGSTANLTRSGGLLPTARMVRLLPPDRDVVFGRARIRAQVDARVRRLVYLLDGKRVAIRKGEPWDAVLDLGNDPRQRMVVVIAYGAGDVELGRDGLLLNDAARGFKVRIVEPGPGQHVGPVDVEAALDIPEGATLDRLEFYWQNQLVATVRHPPYRQRLFIPVLAKAGFIRVAARLTDGRVAEDVKLMNPDRYEEQVTVNLVELYVVVTDRDGKPIRDLDASDFTILEDGVEQRVETFSRAGGLPITVGLALDSSSSLFLKMPALKEAAAEFVDGLAAEQDQAFLIGFSTHPTVVRATTSDLGRVVDGIESLQPTGNTALWEGVVLSMLQLQEISGRKALVVFYDGDDEDEDFSFTTSLKMAEKVGVPIYLVIMNNALARTGPSGFTTKHRAERLERIARTGGGRVFYVSTEGDLRPIFTAIRDELRSHYLLTYYPAAPTGEGATGEDALPRWRPIEVRVDRPGLTARTLQGYENL